MVIGTHQVFPSPLALCHGRRLHSHSFVCSADATTIKAVQRYRTPFLDTLFRTVSLFGELNDLRVCFVGDAANKTKGDEMAYTLGLPVVCWTSPDMTLCTYVIISWVLVFYSGHALKDYWQLPRPFRVDPQVVCLEQHFVDEYGLPSTHAQAAWCIPLVWLVLAWPSHMPLAIAAYLLYAVSISFSRVYLGVHSLIDVFVGSTLGLLIAAFVLWNAVALRALLTRPLFAVLLPCVALATYPCEKKLTPSYRDTASIFGVTSGVWLGDFVLSTLQLSPAVPLTWSVFAVRIVAGLVVLVVGHEVAKRIVWRVIVAVSGQNDTNNARLVIPYKYISYLGIGFNSCVGVPILLFRHLGVTLW